MVLCKMVPLEKAPTCKVPEGCRWNAVVFWCPVPQEPSESKMLEGLLTWVMSRDRDQEQQVPPEGEDLQESCQLKVPVKMREMVSLRPCARGCSLGPGDSHLPWMFRR